MNGSEENKFDQILKSKLNGHQLEPSRNLLPGILDSIADSSAGSEGGSGWKWTSLSGVLLLMVAGYFIINSFGNGRKTADKNIGDEQVKEEINDINYESVSFKKSDISSEEYNKSNEVPNLGDTYITSSKDSKTSEIDRRSSVKNITVNQNGSSINDSENSIVNSTDNLANRGGTFKSNSRIKTEEKPSLSSKKKVVSTPAKSSEDIEMFSTEMASSAVVSKNEAHLNTKETTSNDSNELTSIQGLMPTLASKDDFALFADDLKEIDSSSTDGEKNLAAQVLDLKSSKESMNENEVQINEVQEQTNADENLGDISSTENKATTDNPVINSDIISTLDSSSFAVQENNWSIDILAGPSLSYRTFNVAENQDLEDHKNNSESSLITYSYNLQVMRKISQKWKGHVGFMYLRMGEKYSFSNAVASHSATNQYDYVSIPIGVNYNIFKKGKIEMFAGVGAQLNYLQKGTSSWLDPHNYSAQTHTNEGEASPFRYQTLAWNANIELRYRLYDRIDLILKEEGIFFNNSIYKKETGIDQREYSFETFLGFGYRF